MTLESEDILSDSLEFLGGKPVIDDNKILYGPLVLSLAPKVWARNPTCPFFLMVFDQFIRKEKCASTNSLSSVK